MQDFTGEEMADFAREEASQHVALYLLVWCIGAFVFAALSKVSYACRAFLLGITG